MREACGLAAYHAGEWAEALAELRASRRMGGAPHVPVMADAERALGRPERALEIARSPESADLPRDEAMELLIVTSGARRDLGEYAAAVVGLQVPDLDVRREDPWTPRLFYAYGEALLAADRREDAVRAFLDAAQTDADGETDAEERAALVAAGVDTLPGDLEDEVVPDDASDAAVGGATTAHTGDEHTGPGETDALEDADAITDDADEVDADEVDDAGLGRPTPSRTPTRSVTRSTRTRSTGSTRVRSPTPTPTPNDTDTDNEDGDAEPLSTTSAEADEATSKDPAAEDPAAEESAP